MFRLILKSSPQASWNTAQSHLYKLEAEGVVKGKRVSKQNQWVLTKAAVP